MLAVDSLESFDTVREFPVRGHGFAQGETGEITSHTHRSTELEVVFQSKLDVTFTLRAGNLA